MARHLVAVLASLLLVGSHYCAPLTFTGSESLFTYKVQVGTESGSHFHQGYAIESRVTLRSQASGGYIVQLSDVQLKGSTSGAIAEAGYKKLKENLETPFGFDSGSQLLSIYAPETLASDSVAFKQGLVNVLEFYDSGRKQLVKLSTGGSSGRCEEFVNTVAGGDDSKSVTESTRFSNLENNCTGQAVPHLLVKKRGLSCKGTACGAGVKVRRSVIYNVKRSGPGADAVFSLRSTEHIRPESAIPSAWFDELVAKSQLTLDSVREATPLDWTPTTAATVGTEVNLESKKPEPDQAKLLEAAKKQFEKFTHCIEKLDTGSESHDEHDDHAPHAGHAAHEGHAHEEHATHEGHATHQGHDHTGKESHLEGHELPELIVTAAMTLEQLDSDSIKALYRSLKTREQKVAFGQTLGLASTSASFYALRDLYLEVVKVSGADVDYLGERFAEYYELLDLKGYKMDAKTTKAMAEFWKQIYADPTTNKRLKASAILVPSAILYNKCFKPSRPGSPAKDPDCPDTGKIWAALAATDPLGSDPLLLQLKQLIITNTELKEGVAWLAGLVTDKSQPLHIRSHSAWSLLQVARLNRDEVLPVARRLFFDRAEDHEIRVAAFVAVLRASRSGNDPSSLVSYLVENADTEDTQLVTWVASYIKNMAEARVPEGSTCPDLRKLIKPIWESLVAPEYSLIGPKTLWDSQVFYLQTHDARESLFLSVIAQKSDSLPRSIYAIARDPLQARSVSIHTTSDGTVYNNLAQLKAALDQMQGATAGPKPADDAATRAEINAILGKFDVPPTSSAFSLNAVKLIDNRAVTFKEYSKPEELLSRYMKKVGAKRPSRSFNIFNRIHAQTHTESGLRVNFGTAQTTAESISAPNIVVGALSRTGLPISVTNTFRKFVGKSFFSSNAPVPDSQLLFVSGRISLKGHAVERNGTVLIAQKKVGELKVVTVKATADPLQGARSKDLFVRSVNKFSGLINSWHELGKLIRDQADKRPLQQELWGHEYFGLGFTVSKSVGYQRPSPWRSPLSRWCMHYVQLDDQTAPFTFKLAASANPDPAKSSKSGYSVTFAKGLQGNKYLRIFGIDFPSPADPAKNSLRFVLGKATQIDDPNRKQVLFSVENSVKGLYLRSHYEVRMPENTYPVHQVTKYAADNWPAAYGLEKIKVSGKAKWTASGRDSFDVTAEVNDLLTGFSSADASSESEFYRTDEQQRLYAEATDLKHLNLNLVGDDGSDGSAEHHHHKPGHNAYLEIIESANQHPVTAFAAWQRLLKFYGFNFQLKLANKPPEQIAHLWQRIRFLMVKKNYKYMTYDLSSKAPEGVINVYINASVDDQRVDAVIQESKGTTRFTGFKAYLMPKLRPSSSPIELRSRATLNKPICTVLSVLDRTEVETFDGADLNEYSLKDGCSYLLAGNCRGRRTWAITYDRVAQVITIRSAGQATIEVSNTGFKVGGVAQPAKQGLVAKVGATLLFEYKGLLKAVLPNDQVEVTREKGGSVWFIEASRLFRSRVCGLCGDFDGNRANDAKFINLEQSATCPA